MRTPARSHYLDVLRGLAIFLVLGAHMSVPESMPGFLQSISFFFNKVGWSGVDLFFVLSGFLVSQLLFKEWKKTGNIRFPRFFIRRGYKIYPQFYLYLLFTILYAEPFTIEKGDRWFRGFLGEAFFLQNYVGKFWPHTWSLAVEEHFYLFLPLLLIAMVKGVRGRNPLRYVPGAFALLAAVALFFRWLEVQDGVIWFGYTMFPTHMRMDALFFGVLISYLHVFRAELLKPLASPVSRAFLITAAVALLLPVYLLPVESIPVQSIGLTANFLGYGALLIFVLTLKEPQRVSMPVRFASLVGRCSYGVYLWHIVARTEWDRLIFSLSDEPPWWVATGGYLASSIVLGWLLTTFVEIPILRYRDRAHPAW